MYLHPLIRTLLGGAAITIGVPTLQHLLAATHPIAYLGACLIFGAALGLALRPGLYAPPALVLASGEHEYLARWHLVTTRWFRIYLHRISHPDVDRHLHNHPTPWVCFVLRGWYEQELKRVAVHVDTGMPATDYLGRYWLEDHTPYRGKVRWVNRLDRLDYHRITSVRPNTWTVCVSGGRRDTDARWGFMVDGRHIDAEEYTG